MAVMTDSPTNAVATFSAGNGEQPKKTRNKQKKMRKLLDDGRRAQASATHRMLIAHLKRYGWNW